MTWIHAPAGAGKTTLLSTYLGARKARVLWYEVDAGDVDVSGVFHFLRRGAEALCGKRLDLPVPRPGSPDAQRAFARRFFEALFSRLPQGTFLVFDNYQDAGADPAWNETFRELCATLTRRVRVIVASRVAPDANLDSPSIATIEQCERTLMDLYGGLFGADDDPPPVAHTREQLRRRLTKAIANLDRLWLHLERPSVAPASAVRSRPGSPASGS